MSNQSWGVVVARFQTPLLHQGHVKLLQYAAEKHPGRLLVVLGVNPALPSDIDPLPFGLRADMVRRVVPEAIVIPQSNYKEDRQWSRTLDHQIRICTGNSPATIYAGRNSFQEHYHGKFPVEVLNFGVDHLSSTQIREGISLTHHYNPESFMAGMIYAYQQLPGIVYPTVDMAIVNPDADSVLLGRKADESQFRFPGGMFDGGADKSYREAASREAYEETRISVQMSEWDYVGDFAVQDWRSRGSKSHHWHTTLFATRLPWGASGIAGDDLVDVRWVPITERLSQSSRLVEEHWDLWDAVVSFIQNNYRSV